MERVGQLKLDVDLLEFAFDGELEACPTLRLTLRLHFGACALKEVKKLLEQSADPMAKARQVLQLENDSGRPRQ